jgi:peptide/nickel transport system permease protein
MADTTPSQPRSMTAGGRLQAYRTRAARIGELVQGVLKSPPTLIGAAVIALLILMAVFAPLLVKPNTPNAYQMPRDWSAINVPPGSPGHLLGTDPTGGDVLYGIVWGARTSLRLALIVVGATLLIGVAVGSLAGFLGGRWDGFLMRIVDVVLAVPEMILALAIAGLLGPSFRNIMLALVVTGWTGFARLIRAEILHVKQEEYVDAARVMGDSRWRIYLKDVLPNSLTPVVVMATLNMGKVVLMGATLSFIGLAEAGLAEWGNLVSVGQEVVLGGRWWTATFGGAMVFVWALSFNLVGDGLRDILDPRTEGR